MSKPRPPYVLVIDQGGHSSRALIFDSELNVVAQSQISIDTFHPQSRFVEHSPTELADSLKLVISTIALQLGSDLSLIQAAGLACQRSSIVCWNKQTGDALSPVISWQDTRGYQYLETLKAGQARIQSKTGLRLSPYYGASKMRWCLNNISEVSDDLHNNQLVIGPLATWLTVQLTSDPQAKADRVNAARTLLMNLADGEWDSGLCKWFEVPEPVLPELANNNTDFGELEIRGHKIPLHYVTGDQPAALFAIGQPDPNALYLNIGSGAFLQRILEGTVKPVEGLLNSLVESANGQQLYSLEATINGAANALDWLSEREGVDVVPQLDEWLQEETGVVFINTVSGLAAPWWRADIESRFVSDGDSRSRAIAVIESIVFLVKVNMDRMAEVLDPPGRIIVSGGLSRLDGLCSRMAALTGVAVHRMQEVEATALGVARRLLPIAKYEPEFDIFCPASYSDLENRYRAWIGEMEKLLNGDG